MSGNVPEFMRNLVPISLQASVAAVLRNATIFVIPDYLAIGSDSEYFLTPMTPLIAQRICTATGCMLPTRKMVDSIYAAATVKLFPQPIAPSAAMITVPVFLQHNDSVRQQRSPFLGVRPLGALVGGDKKDVILSNRIYSNLKPNVPRPVVIYGRHQLSGVPIQPVYNGHEETYADYSHGIRLVRDSMMLDGGTASVSGVLRDPQLCILLSDEGVIQRSGYGMTTDAPEQGEEETRGNADPPIYGVQENYPNPFNSTTKIPFTLTRPESVRLNVFDLLGREVRIIVDGTMAPGKHDILFDARGLASGTYVLRLQTPSFVHSRTICLIQ